MMLPNVTFTNLSEDCVPWMRARTALAVSVLVTMSGCGGGGSSPAPTPTPTPKPVAQAILTATVFNATATRNATGMHYVLPVTIIDVGGVGSSLTTTDITYFVGAVNSGTSHIDHPTGANALTIHANGTQRFDFNVDDADGSSPPFTRAEFRIAYKDDNGNTGILTAAGDIAPPPSLALAGNLTLTATVKSRPAGVAQVLIQVSRGPNAGRSIPGEAMH
jgi:hypothetical protein